jgi:hypothetical protein
MSYHEILARTRSNMRHKILDEFLKINPEINVRRLNQIIDEIIIANFEIRPFMKLVEENNTETEWRLLHNIVIKKEDFIYRELAKLGLVTTPFICKPTEIP